MLTSFASALATGESASTPGSRSGDGVLAPGLLGQLSAQLAEWRGMLPKELQWDSDSPACNPARPSTFDVLTDSSMMEDVKDSEPVFFRSDLTVPMSRVLYAYDIQVALLRSRYCHANYVAHRPFIYKALHFPEQITQEDAEGVAVCLRVSNCCCQCSKRWKMLTSDSPVSTGLFSTRLHRNAKTSCLSCAAGPRTSWASCSS